MNKELSNLLGSLECKAIEDEDYENILKVRAMDLPTDYLDFISTCNGACGTLGEYGIHAIFWTVGDILALNPYYKEDEFSQSVIIVGSSGGGTNYGYYPKEGIFFHTDVYMMNAKEITRCGPTFFDFVQYLSLLKEPV